MLQIAFPPHEFRMKMENNRDMIFDELRKRWVVLTPEEWVRQHFLLYLTKVPQYPASLIAVEKEIRVGELRKRFDILVYDRNHQPWMMIECKAASVQLEQAVLEQLLRYHIAVPVPYLVITNGHSTRGFGKRENRLYELEELPGLG